jgi:multicomponent Na+:H+ antiporter subunit G
MIVAYVFFILGGLFYLLGGLGVLRMPDTFNRIQAGTKATTLGTFSMLFGLVFINPVLIPKVLIIIIFIALSNPVGSTTLANAVLKANGVPDNIKTNDLEKGKQS